ncbi:hypothetical protein CH063_14819, partial [Colletotrichum higginsianum]
MSHRAFIAIQEGIPRTKDPADAVKIRGDRRITFQGNADPGVLYGTHEAMTKAVE